MKWKVEVEWTTVVVDWLELERNLVQMLKLAALKTGLVPNQVVEVNQAVGLNQVHILEQIEGLQWHCVKADLQSGPVTVVLLETLEAELIPELRPIQGLKPIQVSGYFLAVVPTVVHHDFHFHAALVEIQDEMASAVVEGALDIVIDCPLDPFGYSVDLLPIHECLQAQKRVERLRKDEIYVVDVEGETLVDSSPLVAASFAE